MWVTAVAAAVARDTMTPESAFTVIVGVNGLNLASFEEFAGGLASRLPPDCETLAAWASRAIAPAIEAA